MLTGLLEWPYLDEPLGVRLGLDLLGEAVVADASVLSGEGIREVQGVFAFFLV